MASKALKIKKSKKVSTILEVMVRGFQALEKLSKEIDRTPSRGLLTVACNYTAVDFLTVSLFQSNEDSSRSCHSTIGE